MANLSNTIVNGVLRVLNGLYVNTINGVTVGNSPKFTDTNTIYSFATGDSNGQIKVTPSGGSAQNISVKGLGSAAYTASTAYAAASHAHGNIQNGGTLQSTDIAIASGDKLVVTDSSDSNKVARTSIAFDGSTATKALTQKGTWESFTNNAGTITGIKMNGASKGTSGVVDLGTVLTSHQDISGKVNKSGDTMTGQLTLAGSDLKLGTTGSSSDDCSDIAWFYGNGQEKARLWTQNEYTAESGLNFRLYKKDGTSLFSGTIPLRNTWRGIQDNLTSSTNTTESLSAKQGYLLANGSARDSTKVAKSGDTMTGNLTIKRTSTNAQNYPAQLILSTVDSTNSNNTSTGTISAYQAGVNGSTMVISPAGNMFIGSGEAATNHYGAGFAHNEGEVLYLTSDNQVHIQANGQTIANRVGIQIDNSGNVIPDKADVATNNIGSIGTSSYKFANGYFTKINGYTLAAACAKAVDTSISTASTSANLPTSAAVASFVEGKGYTSNVGTITGIKMNGSSKGTSGVVDLGTVLTSHQDISGKADKSTTISKVEWDSTNKKLTKTINGTTSDIVTGATILGGLTKSQVTTALGYTPPTQNTTYSSKAAASGGTDVSLVTTGEKYTWNNKGNGTVTQVKIGTTAYNPSNGVISLPAYPTGGSGTVTKVTAGTGLTGGNITTTGTIALATSGATAGSYGPSSAVTGNDGTTMNVPYITVDAYGRVTSISNKVYTAKNTNTWRGVQNNLTSTATDQSLSAAQGKALNDKINNWTTAQTLSEGTTSVTFTGLNSSYAYSLYSETADGTPVYVTKSVASGTQITYTLIAITSAQAGTSGTGCKVKLKCLY